jgi:hypothetical protein
MAMLLCVLCGVIDTLRLPEPALAIFATTDGELGYLTRTGEEILIKESEGWQTYALPERVLLIQRIVAKGSLCYVLSEQRLTLFDLRTSRKSIIAEDVNDVAINRYGELWALSEFTLRRLSPLGRELEVRKLKVIPGSIWMLEDSLYLSNDEMPPLYEKIKEDLGKAGVRVEEFLSPHLAFHKEVLYLLLDSRNVLRVSPIES